MTNSPNLTVNSDRRNSLDAAYRRTTNRLGAALLIFLVLYEVLFVLAGYLSELTGAFLNPREQYVVSDLADSAAYLLSFMLPVLFFRWITPKAERRPMPLSPTLPRGIGLMIPAAIAVIIGAAIINAEVMELFQFSASELFPESTDESGYRGVLLFISTAIVPAFCEEFLFRGLVLTQLRPYGKTVAILGSALLFGLMHQNPGQIFYATMAGIVLGLLCYETGSLWAGTLVHMFNNLLSVAEEILDSSLPSDVSYRVCGAIEVLLIGIGLVCLAVLILRRDRSDNARRSGAVLFAARDTAEDSAPRSGQIRTLRGFFSPLMTTFIVLTIIEMISLLVILKFLL